MTILPPALPAGFTGRPHTIEDAGIAATLVADCEEFEDGEREMTEADIRAFWSVPGLDLAASSFAVFHGDRLVATSDVREDYAAVDVHPDFRGRGIGSAMLPWTWARARAQGSDRVGQTVSDRRTDARALFAANGYEATYESWLLRMPIAGLAHPTLPEGYTLHDLDYAADGREIFDVVFAAFAEWLDRPERWDDWDVFNGHHTNLRSWGSPVLRHEGRIVGAVIAFDYGPASDAWIQQLAVDREHRGRGLGGAMIRASFARFAEHGHAHGGLGTDSRFGTALAMYEHVGFSVRASSTHWERRL